MKLKELLDITGEDTNIRLLDKKGQLLVFYTMDNKKDLKYYINFKVLYQQTENFFGVRLNICIDY